MGQRSNQRKVSTKTRISSNNIKTTTISEASNDEYDNYHYESRRNGWIDPEGKYVAAYTPDQPFTLSGEVNKGFYKYYINETSYVENCETSAWGRALGNFGIGIDTSVASADEVVNATNSQKQQQWLTQTQFVNTLKGTKKQAQNVLEKYKMKKEYRNEILTKFKIKWVKQKQSM